MLYKLTNTTFIVEYIFSLLTFSFIFENNLYALSKEGCFLKMFS